MNDQAAEARLAALIAEYADRAPTDVDATAMARRVVAGTPQARRLLLGSTPVGHARWLAFLLLAVLVAIIAGALASGQVPLPRDPTRLLDRGYRGVFEPAGVLAGPFLEAARLPDGRVLIVESGGELEFYDPGMAGFVPGGIAPAIVSHIAGPPHEVGAVRLVVLDDGQVVQPALPGRRCRAPGEPRLVLFDPRIGSVVESGLVTSGGPKDACAPDVLETLDDGRVLVVGRAAELFDPATGTYSLLGPMGDDFEAAGAIRLADGRILLIGTFRPLHEGHRPRILDPSSGTFALAGSTIPGLGAGSFTTTRLADGRVLIAGGNGWEVGVATDRAELFDPVFGTFSAVGPLTEPRTGHAAALLADGRVVIVGGMTTDPDARSRAHATASAEIFDPATGQFTPTADMSLPRVGASAFSLADGSVLVLGGSDQPSAEIYR